MAGRQTGYPKKLIQAAVDAAENDDVDDDFKTPVEIVLAGNIERWGAPAVIGSAPLDWGELSRMNYLLNIYRAIKTVRSAEGEQIHRVPPSDLKLIKWLRDEGYMDGD